MRYKDLGAKPLAKICQTIRDRDWVGLPWCSGNASDLINKVTLRRAGLVLRWVTACGQVNHLGM